MLRRQTSPAPLFIKTFTCFCKTGLNRTNLCLALVIVALWAEQLHILAWQACHNSPANHLPLFGFALVDRGSPPQSWITHVTHSAKCQQPLQWSADLFLVWVNGQVSHCAQLKPHVAIWDFCEHHKNPRLGPGFSFESSWRWHGYTEMSEGNKKRGGKSSVTV